MERLILSTASLDVSAAGILEKSPSEALPKQLGFFDLVFASVLLVAIPDFFGTGCGQPDWLRRENHRGPAGRKLHRLGIVLSATPPEHQELLVISHRPLAYVTCGYVTRERLARLGQ